MSLDQWVANGWIRAHSTSRQEVQELLEGAERDMVDAQQTISADWRFSIAYNAALRLSTAALFAAGYRVERERKHYRTFSALPMILDPSVQDLADFFDQCRTKRHDVTYESIGAISDAEVHDLVEAVKDLKVKVTSWLRTSHPDLL